VPLTVTEKEHWKKRISKKINKKIEALYAADPNLRERLKRTAHEQALKSLKVATLFKEKEKAEAKKNEWGAKMTEITNKIEKTIKKNSPASETQSCHYHYNQTSEVDNCINLRQAAHFDVLLAKDKTGKKILKMQDEKEGVLDAVWLATGTKEIKELWSACEKLFDIDSPTQLVSRAAKMAPVEE
jgi:hypothetical protein